MSKSHSRHAQRVQADKPKPPAPPAEGEPVPPPVVSTADDRAWGPGYRLALFVWLVGFFALLAWIVFDLLKGLFS